MWRATGPRRGVLLDVGRPAAASTRRGSEAQQEFVQALDVKTGAKIWETATGRAFRESRGNGPRGTPTIDGDRLYAMAADGTLVMSRRRVRQVDLVAEHRAEIRRTASSRGG